MNDALRTTQELENDLEESSGVGLRLDDSRGEPAKQQRLFLDMLEQDRKQFGPDSLVYTYWKQLIGDPAADKAAIEAISPYKLAQNFVAPVLLIHGDEDTVVPVRQSRRMENALKDAGKEVTYLKINGDDHSLVANESRVQALSALGSFLRQHIAP